MKVLFKIEQGRYKFAEAVSLVPTSRNTIRVKYPSGKRSEWNKDGVLDEKYRPLCFDLM